MVEMSELTADGFQLLWNYYSQYSHALSFTFYRMEQEGRGTGLKNDFDEDALTFCLNTGARQLERSTSLIVSAFPEASMARQGLASDFCPSPER